MVHPNGDEPSVVAIDQTRIDVIEEHPQPHLPTGNAHDEIAQSSVELCPVKRVGLLRVVAHPNLRKQCKQEEERQNSVRPSNTPLRDPTDIFMRLRIQDAHLCVRKAKNLAKKRKGDRDAFECNVQYLPPSPVAADVGDHQAQNCKDAPTEEHQPSMCRF